MTVEGIDISYWQTTTPSLAGREFVIARATYGTRVDSRYAQHAANVRRAGKVLGAYAFGIYGDGAAQARAFLQVASGADLFVLDLEKEGDNPKMSATQARAFIATVKATGRKCGLYHSLSGFPSLGQDYNWVAKWSSTPPSIRWDFWQYRGSPLDLDRWRGTLAELRAFAGSTGGSADVKKITASGYRVSSGKKLRLRAGTQLLHFDGTPLTKLSADADVEAFGLVDGHSGDYVIRITTGAGYADGVARETLAMVKSSGPLIDVPAPTTEPGTITQADVDAAKKTAAKAAAFDVSTAAADRAAQYG